MHPVKADFSSLVHDMSIYTCWMQLSLYCFLFSNVSSGSYPIIFIYVFPGGSDGKASAYNARDLGSIPGFGRSHGEGKGYSLQYSDLENSMDKSLQDCKELHMTE